MKLIVTSFVLFCVISTFAAPLGEENAVPGVNWQNGEDFIQESEEITEESVRRKRIERSADPNVIDNVMNTVSNMGQRASETGSRVFEDGTRIFGDGASLFTALGVDAVNMLSDGITGGLSVFGALGNPDYPIVGLRGSGTRGLDRNGGMGAAGGSGGAVGGTGGSGGATGGFGGGPGGFGGLGGLVDENIGFSANIGGMKANFGTDFRVPSAGTGPGAVASMRATAPTGANFGADLSASGAGTAPASGAALGADVAPPGADVAPPGANVAPPGADVAPPGVSKV